MDIIHGPDGNGHFCRVLMKSGVTKDYAYHGYMWQSTARFIPQSRRVKVKALALCDTCYTKSGTPMLEGWYLLGLYVAGHWPGVFVLCDALLEPIQVFAPPGLPPRPSRRAA
jgi:hypothetical protein